MDVDDRPLLNRRLTCFLSSFSFTCRKNSPIWFERVCLGEVVRRGRRRLETKYSLMKTGVDEEVKLTTAGPCLVLL